MFLFPLIIPCFPLRPPSASCHLRLEKAPSCSCTASLDGSMYRHSRPRLDVFFPTVFPTSCFSTAYFWKNMAFFSFKVLSSGGCLHITPEAVFSSAPPTYTIPIQIFYFAIFTSIADVRPAQWGRGGLSCRTSKKIDTAQPCRHIDLLPLSFLSVAVGSFRFGPPTNRTVRCVPQGLHKWAWELRSRSVLSSHFLRLQW